MGTKQVGTKRRGLILDRDGVINIDRGYVGSVTQFDFMPGLFPFLRAAVDKGYLLAVATNQSGVARGFYSEQDYEAVTAHMLAELRRETIDISLTLACFAHPEGKIAPYAFESFWRKPNPGMVLEAVRRLDLEAGRSAFLGDALRDMQAAQGGGIGNCLWLTQEKTAPKGVALVPDFTAALERL
ncbi:MAG: HAD family hydrolase [Alphaproteobacteria bacterium]|nr:HAD family hydrolase [Alphaproteobacteria bacterium]